MTKADRLEDLGRLREKLNAIIENNLFHDCDSKHQFEAWKKTLDGDTESEKLYDVHLRLRFHLESIVECYIIACGNDDS